MHVYKICIVQVPVTSTPKYVYFYAYLMHVLLNCNLELRRFVVCTTVVYSNFFPNLDPSFQRNLASKNQNSTWISELARLNFDQRRHPSWPYFFSQRKTLERYISATQSFRTSNNINSPSNWQCRSVPFWHPHSWHLMRVKCFVDDSKETKSSGQVQQKPICCDLTQPATWYRSTDPWIRMTGPYICHFV